MKFLQKFVCLLAFFSVAQLEAQNSQFTNYSVKEGLPQSQVFDIVQDSIGYLWLGTQGGGIARFDGKSFTVYNDKNGLRSNFVNALMVKNDSLLIATNQGLSIKVNNNFSNYKSPKINKFISIATKVYLATTEGVYALKEDYIVPIEINLQIDLSSVNDLLFDGTFYWFATNRGLWKTNSLLHPSQVERIDSEIYTSLLLFRNKVIAASYKNGIKIIEGKTVTTIHKSIKYIISLQKINTDELWIATQNNGFIILSSNDLSIKRKIDLTNGLETNSVQKVFKDRQENLWIATSGNGIYHLTQNNFKHYNKENGLDGKRVRAIHFNKGNIWLSNSKNNLLKIDYLGISAIYISEKHLEVTTIASDSNNNIWVGTKRNGLFIHRENSIETLNSSNGFPFNNIKNILIQNNAVWVATQASGIVKLDYDFEKGIVKKTTQFNKNNGVQELSMIAMTASDSDNIWYATKTGAIGYIENDTIKKHLQITKNKTPINNIVIHNDRMYLGTLGTGVWWANMSNLTAFQKLTGDQQLVSDNSYQLIFDRDQHLWLGTEKGVDRITLNDSNLITEVTHFGKNDGFIGIETSLNAVDKDDIGNIRFGTANGISQYISTNSQNKTSTPLLFFEKIAIAYQALDSINLNTYSKVLSLSPRKNHLSFQFKTVDLNNADNVNYRWKLKGAYSPWTSKNTIELANLEAGNYTFTVQSRNSKWAESEPKTFQFFIDKPLHQKTWFLGLITFIIIVILIVFILRYIKQVKFKKDLKIQQLELENHLQSLEQKALQLQMNPHFIFNVLNGIKGMGNSGDMEGLNKTISQFAALLRSMLYNSRQEEINLQQEIDSISNYIELEQQMAVNTFEYSINIKNIDIDLEEILIPPMLLQPFIENSIKHGFKGLSKKGQLSISFAIKNDFLSCSIQDNGIGIHQSKKDKTTENHHSMALKITKERIERLSSKNAFMIDEFLENNTIIGTKVEFRIPLKTDY
ncbi:MAG: histidine kinase [Flavobacteriaceae bacterium]|nr:histidine kinase [Flavobacteriaceae bacterium]